MNRENKFEALCDKCEDLLNNIATLQQQSDNMEIQLQGYKKRNASQEHLATESIEFELQSEEQQEMHIDLDISSKKRKAPTDKSRNVRQSKCACVYNM